VADVAVTLVRVPHDGATQPLPTMLQVTPLFWVSFCRLAVKSCDCPTCKVLEAGETATDICVTENWMLLLVTPFTVMFTLPVVVPLGTVAATAVALQLFAVAGSPLKLTMLEPCVWPKFVPVIVTVVATGPETGDRLVIIGVVVFCELVVVLNAARVAIQLLAGDKVQVAANGPASACTPSSSA